MALWFQAVRYKNFLSTGNTFTEVKLDKSPATLVVGKNGEGKSTIGDAICFAAFGKPFRKIKKAQLVNSINMGGLETELEFIGHDNKQYLIRRGLKPDFFEIYQDGQVVDHTGTKDMQAYLEESILRMNFKTFTQVVFLGAASFVPFMQLPTGIRREIIEDLLDIRVFSRMNALLKDKVLSNKNAVSSLKQELDNLQELRQALVDHQMQLAQHHENQLQDYQDQIAGHKQTITALEVQLASVETQIKTYETQLKGQRAAKDMQAKMFQILADLKKKIKRLQSTIDFYKDNDSCPTCEQALVDTFKANKVADTVNELATVQAGRIELEAQIAAHEIEVAAFDKIETDKALAVQNWSTFKASIDSEKTAIKVLEHAASKLAKVDTTAEKLEVLDSKILTAQNKHEEALKDREVMDIATIILRDDGIKAKIVQQYITIINQLVNKYLAALDFFVSFELDENFEEVIRSRHRDEFSYENFSEGEKMRIDLAILFTWRAIAKMKNSASTNLLILDEVFDASLDAAGCEEFMKLINSLDQCNVFVISHKTDILVDKFKEIIRFEKHKNFSTIVT